MWRIEILNGKWWVAGWIAGSFHACLEVVETYPGETRLIPIHGEPGWLVQCPHCYCPMVHYAKTECRMCGDYEDFYEIYHVEWK